ncbi:O-antigen ligase family protein [Desertimonas flava]|uniref:O-antigen ligase family protein n=1 Tax=Desertimonas flava TaxID=2064846 RepID=UPI0013C4A79E|nr:O-antigen ligase family protein [Desertimonas flava]
MTPSLVGRGLLRARHRRGNPLGAGLALPITLFALVVVAAVPDSAHDLLLYLPLLIVACGAVVAGLAEPRLAVLYLLIAMFFRLAVPDILPVDPFVLAYVGVLLSVSIWLSIRRNHLPRLGIVESAMVLYLAWNIYSMLDTNHALEAVYPRTNEELSVYRFILTGTAIPLSMYVVGRTFYRRRADVTIVLWALLAFGGYSAAVSIMQFHGPQGLVWPRYIVDSPNWVGRANGVFNQPVVNGLALTAGFLAGLFLAVQPRSRRWITMLSAGTSVAAAYGIYLTHTRAVWLAFVLVCVIGAMCSDSMRRGFIAVLLVVTVGVAATWSTFTSADRDAGGIGSANEIHDRLNSIATSLWAFEREPFTGWGIGRFTAINTVHHQQFSQDVSWVRGYGIASHFNELGILVELGVVGLMLWLTAIVLIIVRLTEMYRSQSNDLFVREFVLLALLLLGSVILAGLTVDLRFFDFPVAATMLLVGMALEASRCNDLGERSRIEPVENLS